MDIPNHFGVGIRYAKSVENATVDVSWYIRLRQTTYYKSGSPVLWGFSLESVSKMPMNCRKNVNLKNIKPNHQSPFYEAITVVFDRCRDLYLLRQQQEIRGHAGGHAK